MKFVCSHCFLCMDSAKKKKFVKKKQCKDHIHNKMEHTEKKELQHEDMKRQTDMFGG